MGSEQGTPGRAGAHGSEGDSAGGFSLELSEDLRDMRDWVHDFAATVIRPAGAEWDERKATPWPILEAASKIGLYSLDFFAQQAFEPSGLGIVIAFEELFWGDSGIALSLVGSSLAAWFAGSRRVAACAVIALLCGHDNSYHRPSSLAHHWRHVRLRAISY